VTPQQSRSIDTSTLHRVQPARPVSIATPIVPKLPDHLTQSTVMISSLPSISTNVDGITRQFYGGRTLPVRRLVRP
jgi:hypothetical protein